MKLFHLFPLAVVAQLLVAAPPEIDPEQLAEFERKVARRVIPNLDGDQNFKRADRLNKEVEVRLASFLRTVEKTTLISETNTPAAAEEEEEGDPLNDLLKPSPDSLLITNDKGIYLDGETYEIVYLGNIKMEGQGVTMTCREDLKALFHPPEDKAKDDKKEGDEKEEPLAKFGGFGELKQFTAAGDVRINGVNEKGQKFNLIGDRALYEMVKDGEKVSSTITFRGDKLTFILGDPLDKENTEVSVVLRSISKNATAVVTLKDNVAKVRTSDKGWVTRLGLPTEKKK